MIRRGPFNLKRIIVPSVLLVILLLTATIIYNIAKSNSLVCMQVSQNGSCILLETVSSPQDTTKGLGGRDSIPKGTGMLFYFGKEYKHCIWMKDMKFSLDILWIDKNKKIVKLMERVNPESFPKSFCPDQDVKWVVELNAGEAATYGIFLGQQLDF
jgi:uncharacterized protein